jgi:hypothetical protein
MILLSGLPAESMILSAWAESIILSAGSPKQQSTKSCNGKCSNDGGGRSNSGGSDGFDVGSGDDDCSDNSNGDDNGDGDSSDGDSGNYNSNSDNDGGNSDSRGKNNNKLKAAVEIAATEIDSGLTLILWRCCWGKRGGNRHAAVLVGRRQGIGGGEG